jgi:hypothetical protein
VPEHALGGGADPQHEDDDGLDEEGSLPPLMDDSDMDEPPLLEDDDEDLGLDSGSDGGEDDDEDYDDDEDGRRAVGPLSTPCCLRVAVCTSPGRLRVPNSQHAAGHAWDE